jgi:hypothetical protein
MMPASKDLHRFLRQHPHAWQYASKASDDYLLARLGIRNALWSGFEMATQAAGKLLKSYLLFCAPSLGGQASSVRTAVSKQAKSLGRHHDLAHDVTAALDLAKDVGLACTPSLRTRLARINDYYLRRYPERGGLDSIGTDELKDVDNAIFEIWDAFKTVNEDYYYTAGLVTPLYTLYLTEHSRPAHQWIRNVVDVMTLGNTAYAARQIDIVTGIKARLALWYPRNR